MMQTRIPVLIAGGGTVGLAAALFLSGKGVDALIVEQQDGPSPHPGPPAWGGARWKCCAPKDFRTP